MLHRTGCWCPGWKTGSTVAYDLPLPARAGDPVQDVETDRCYLLLGQGIQLTQPQRYAGGSIEGWWYVDLVAVDQCDRGYVVHDRYVDFLVPPTGERYDVLDLDDLGEALTSSAMSPVECSTTLRQAQAFLDRYLKDPVLHGAGEREFPPEPVQQLQCLGPFSA